MNPALHNRRGHPFPDPRGFTLIEVLVALLILGIMSALGYGTYRAARISAERTEESMKRSREIEFGMRVLVMDFAQLVPRPVRDPLSQSANRFAALRGSPGNGTSAGTADSSVGSSSSGGSGAGASPTHPAPPSVLKSLHTGGSGSSYEQKSKNLPDVVETG